MLLAVFALAVHSTAQETASPAQAASPPPAVEEDERPAELGNGALVLVASLLSGLIGVLVATYVRAWQDQREIKRDVLRRLAGNRYILTGEGLVQSNGEPFVALNEAFVVFAKEPEVLKALEALRKDDDNRARENIVALIKRMAAAAHVPVTLDDAFIASAFKPPSGREASSEASSGTSGPREEWARS